MAFKDIEISEMVKDSLGEELFRIGAWIQQFDEQTDEMKTNPYGEVR